MELAIVVVLTFVCVLLTKLQVVDEHLTQLFGLASVTFIGLIATLHLHRWFQQVKSDVDEEK